MCISADQAEVADVLVSYEVMCDDFVELRKLLVIALSPRYLTRITSIGSL